MKTTSRYDQLEDGHMDHIDAAVWNGDIFHHRGNIAAFRRMMSRWEAGLKEAEGIMAGADELAKEIDKEAIAMAGASIHAGDGGYSIGTRENYDAFVKKRNYPIPGTNKHG
jgi:hypothetical protein